MRESLPDGITTETHSVETLIQPVREGSEYDPLPMFSGVLDFVYDNNVPALLDLRFAPEHMPMSPYDALAPFGQRLRISQTLRAGADEGTVNLGEYLITETRLQGQQVQVRAQGLEYLILDARLTKPFTASSMHAATLRALCKGIIEVDIDPGLADASLPTSVTEDWADNEDRMAILRSLETSWEASFVVDEDGILVARERPTVGTPVVEWEHGKDNAYVSVTAGATREDIHNAFVQKFRGTDGLDRQTTAYDDDPRSPTYYNGPFGQRPRFAFNPGIVSWTQARKAAADGLKRELRRRTQIVVDAPPDPRIETWDSVAVTLADGTRHVGLIVECGLPLTAGDGPARYVIGEVQSWL